MSGSVRRFERGEHGDVDRGMPLSLSFLISKSRMCLLSDLSFVFFLARNFSSSSRGENDDAREARIRS